MQNWKVLLVDDEEEFVAALGERLQLRGINVSTTTDGEEALRMIDSDPPQVVVLDVLMPGIGGLDVLQHIRKRHPNLPVILLTGHASTRDGIEGMRLGAFDYLMKPLEIEDLIGKLREAVEGSRAIAGK